MEHSVRTETAAPYTIEEDIIKKALDLLYTRLYYSNADLMTCPVEVRNYLQLRCANYEREVFGVMWLTNRHRLITVDELFFGTIDTCMVHPREVVKSALKCNAAAAVLFHNHPSGVAEPSRSDEMLTTRLKEALKLIDIRVLDHIVVGDTHTVSFAERGIL